MFRHIYYALGTAIVRIKHNIFSNTVSLHKCEYVGCITTSELIYRLIVITYHADVRTHFLHDCNQAFLYRVRVLILVNHQVFYPFSDDCTKNSIVFQLFHHFPHNERVVKAFFLVQLALVSLKCKTHLSAPLVRIIPIFIQQAHYPHKQVRFEIFLQPQFFHTHFRIVAFHEQFGMYFIQYRKGLEFLQHFQTETVYRANVHICKAVRVSQHRLSHRVDTIFQFVRRLTCEGKCHYIVRAYIRLLFKMLIIRRVTTPVLPAPAQAIISTSSSIVLTASICCGDKPSNNIISPHPIRLFQYISHYTIIIILPKHYTKINNYL